MARPDGGWIAGYAAPTPDAARGVWTLRDVYQSQRIAPGYWPQPDPQFSNVQLLLHGNGTNNSTTFTDSSSNSRTGTAGGTAVISTTRSRFGSASISVPATSARVTYPAAAAMTLGTSDFTLECWLWLSTSVTGGVLCSSADYQWLLYCNAGALQWYASTNGSTWGIASGTSIGTPTLNTWAHVAISRSGSTFSLYLNGTRSNTVTSSASIYTASTSGFTVGSPDVAGRRDSAVCFVDEVRFTVGTGAARYSGTTITTPVAAFPDR